MLHLSHKINCIWLISELVAGTSCQEEEMGIYIYIFLDVYSYSRMHVTIEINFCHSGFEKLYFVSFRRKDPTCPQKWSPKRDWEIQARWINNASTTHAPLE